MPHIGYDLGETSWAEAHNVTGDTIFEQTEYVYDAAGNTLFVTSRQRLHDATGRHLRWIRHALQPLRRWQCRLAVRRQVGQVAVRRGTRGSVSNAPRSSLSPCTI